MLSLITKINDITTYLSEVIKANNLPNPEIGIILGSGLGEFTQSLEDPIIIPYSEIPHIPKPTAFGHAGNLILGKLGQKMCLALQGRLHLYEGHDVHMATILVRVMKKLGVNNLIITCACGGLNYHFEAGGVMVINDHINFTGFTPLMGPNLDEFGPRFLPMFDIYTPSLIKLAHEVAADNKLKLYEGVYGAILGPNYATRSELRMLIDAHCDAVGMSVVHEAIVAAHSNMQILGLAAITDIALPFSHHHATHEQVVESGKQIAWKMKVLIKEIAKHL